MNVRWIDPVPPSPHLPRFHPDPLLHALLARRVSTPAEAADFLDRSCRPLPDPFALPGMAEAVARLTRAIGTDETVAVFGDYDADGITSAAIATLALRAASAGVLPALVELPTRAAGYGLNPDAIHRFAADGATLLLALDCGSSDHDALALARSLGMDAIVVDHHELHGPPPDGATLVSARLGPASPYGGLSAAGLALLLATAMARSGLDVGDGPGRDPVGLADLAMIGIVADVCDLRGVARAIVRDGLRRTRTVPRPGLTALLKGMDLDPSMLDSRQVARRLGPALNAPGRRADPTPAFDLLMAGSALGANGYVAEVLAALEWARAERTRHAGEQAAQFRDLPGWEGRRVAVLAADECPSGIAGSVASHLAAELARPVVVLGRHGDRLRGSARSFGGFDIGSALQGLSHLLVRSGGHRMAAGLELEAANLERLREALEQAASAAGVEPGPIGVLALDADLPAERIERGTLDLVDGLRPFGEGNPEPLLRVPAATVLDASAFGRDGSHLKIRLRTANGPATAIAWGQADRRREAGPGTAIDLAGRLDRNVWNGRETVRFVAEDFRPASGE